MIRLPRLVDLAIAASALGCGSSEQPLWLEAVTSAPPLAVAELHETDAGAVDITLTKGVALAFTCTDPVTDDSCTSVTTAVTDPSIASVADGFLASGGDVPVSMLVVVGLKAGATTLRLDAAHGGVDIAVKIADL